ncbi:MAG: CPBP family intramembrane metalloprotease [Actinobacteria bacterium]|nr:CPBP family intramembrane metalloprotease [Actinomycetota bacterium]
MAHLAHPRDHVVEPRDGWRAASTWGATVLVAAAVAITFAAGVLFCWLRLRSRSLLAPLLAHLATNGAAFVVAWFVVRGHG